MKIALLQAQSITMNVDICGGLERVELAQMETLAKRGHRVKLYVSRLVGAKPGVKKITALFVPNYRQRLLYYLAVLSGFFYYLNYLLRTVRADILHGHYTPLLPLLAPDRCLVHFHGLGIYELLWYARFKKRYHRGHYVFCAEHIKNDFEEIYPGIPKTQLHVVYNGIDTEMFRPGAKKERKRIKRLIFYAGWIPTKGIYDVLEMARLLEKKRSDIEIYYGGSAYGHYKGFTWGDPDEINAKVRKLAENLTTVKFIGPIVYGDLPGVLRDADIGLVPSTNPDPFPLVPLEMMASGLPVVAYANGGLKESIVDGQTGYLVQTERPDLLAEAVERLLDDDGLRWKMGETACRLVQERYTWERHCLQLEGIYEGIVGRGKGSK